MARVSQCTRTPEPALPGDGPWPLGPVARHFGVPTWQLRRCYERELLPPARRVGPYRTVTREELPAVREVLARAGHLAGDRTEETTP
jgi:hypothetical protein